MRKEKSPSLKRKKITHVRMKNPNQMMMFICCFRTALMTLLREVSVHVANNERSEMICKKGERVVWFGIRTALLRTEAPSVTKGTLHNTVVRSISEL